MKQEHSSRRGKRNGPPLRRSTGSVRLSFPEWVGNYRAAWLRPDIIAGLTLAAVVGLPPERSEYAR